MLTGRRITVPLLLPNEKSDQNENNDFAELEYYHEISEVTPVAALERKSQRTPIQMVEFEEANEFAEHVPQGPRSSLRKQDRFKFMQGEANEQFFSLRRDQNHQSNVFEIETFVQNDDYVEPTRCVFSREGRSFSLRLVEDQNTPPDDDPYYDPIETSSIANRF